MCVVSDVLRSSSEGGEGIDGGNNKSATPLEATAIGRRKPRTSDSSERAGISMHLERRPPGGATIRSIFFTHLHSDHVIDYANLLLGFWPTHQVDVYGPGEAGLPITTYPPGRDFTPIFPDYPTPGLMTVTEYLCRAFAYNINVRMADENRDNVTTKVRTHEIGVTRRGYVPDIDVGRFASGDNPLTAAPDMDPIVIRPTDAYGVTVRAALVQHAPVFPALGYRFDTPHGSVAFSGDALILFRSP